MTAHDDAWRRVTAYGVATRLTGAHDEVTVDGDELVVKFGENSFRQAQGADGTAQGADGSGDVPYPWRSDETASAAISDYVEEYLDETGVTVSIRRDRFDDLVADPYDEWNLEFLAHRFPAADLHEIHTFLDKAKG